MEERLVDSELKDLLRGLDFDIRAESFFAHISDDSEVFYKFQNFFDRNYSRDIIDIKEPLDNDSGVYYAFLSRLGLYDIFPEIFFHDQRNRQGASNMASDYKKRKKEEKLARIFFEPIENELFQFFLDTEKHENEIISALGDREFLGILNKIWDIDDSLPYRELSKVIKFLPFTHKISGDISAITYILEHIFNNKIEVTEEPVILDTDVMDETDLFLGNNFALKAPKTTYLKKYIFTLIEIKDIENIREYFNTGKINKVLSLFLESTMSYDSEYEIRFSIMPEKQEFVLDSKPYTGRINISTTLAQE